MESYKEQPFKKIEDILSEDRLISSINESVKESEKNFDDARIEKIKKDFNRLRDRFFIPKNKRGKNLHRIENKNIKRLKKALN